MRRSILIASRTSFIAFAFSLCAGCQTSEPANGAASATPSGAASAPVATASATSAPAGLKSAFSIVAEAPDPFYIYALKGGAFVDAAGFLAQLGDGPLKQTPAVMKGLEKGASGKILGGTPDPTWLIADDTYKWINDRWAPQPLIREGEQLLDIAAWNDGRAVAAIGMPNNDMRFFLAGGKPGVVMPAPSGPTKAAPVAAASASAGTVPAAASASAAAPPSTPPPSDDAKPADDNACKVRMKPESVSLAGLPSGELFAAGYECLPTSRGVAIAEHWDAKKVRGTVDVLPKSEGDAGIDVRGLLARSPTEVYAFGNAGAKAYLARFDGKAWGVEAQTFRGPITALASDDSGTLYAVAGALYKKPTSGAWIEVPLPMLGNDELAPQGVWARTPDDVWVTAASGKGHAALLRSAPSTGAAMTLPSRKTMTDLIATNRRFAATAACDKIFAHLTTIGPSKGDVPNAFPQIKDAFAGQPGFETAKFVVEDDGANLYIGAQVPSIAVGEKVLARFKEKNPKAVTNLFCHEPIMIKKAIVLE